MGMRRQQHDLVRRKAQPLKSAEDDGLKLGSHDHEIEAEDETAMFRAFQQNG
jgi:hypothetical protein